MYVALHVHRPKRVTTALPKLPRGWEYFALMACPQLGEHILGDLSDMEFIHFTARLRRTEI